MCGSKFGILRVYRYLRLKVKVIRSQTMNEEYGYDISSFTYFLFHIHFFPRNYRENKTMK